jgi:hypothetical protein
MLVNLFVNEQNGILSVLYTDLHVAIGFGKTTPAVYTA